MTLETHTIRTAGPRTPPLGPTAAAAALAVTAAAAVALEHGFQAPVLPPALLRALQLVLPLTAVWVSGDVRPAERSLGRWRRRVGALGEGGVALAAVAEFTILPRAAEVLAVAAAIALAIRLNGVLARSMPNPSALFPISFAALIAVSTLLLMLPAATPPRDPVGWVDALFTATSAVCVTGLTVRDTGADYTPFGQAVILGSFQLGGLGVMIFGSTLALLFGARLSYREHVTLSMALDEYPAHRIMRFAWFVIATTLAIEAVGAAVLYYGWPPDAAPAHGRLWTAVFHSVSAFCNAGFDLTGASLTRVDTDAATYLGVMPLVVTGGLGFIVIENLYRVARDRLRGKAAPATVSTHTKLVLWTTAALLLCGFVAIAVAEANAHGGLSSHAALDAMMLTTTSRTAGFTTIDMNELSAGSRFMLMVLMAIGGSPGSTAGGMKNVVFAVIILAVISTVRGRDEVEVFGRALPDAIVKKAATVAAGLLSVIALAVLILDMTESIAFEPLLFEAISAATTTGLSMGATDELSAPGRVVITVAMFLGRVGALTLLAALVGSTGAADRYKLPRDTVSLG